MNNLKYLKKNKSKIKYDTIDIKKICDSAYNEDKERINKAIKYLAKR